MDASSHSKTHQSQKRFLSDESDSGDTSSAFKGNFPKFFVITPTTGKTITDLSPFWIQKSLQATIGTLTSIRKTRIGHLLVETNKALYSQKLALLTDLAGVPVKAEPHQTLNCSKGVIKCADLKGVDKQEIVDGLASQGVTDCFNITIPAGNNTNERRKTNTYILTFNSCTVPHHITVGYLRVKVEVYIPNPLRCFNCQRFGHGKNTCRNEAVCQRCGGKHAEEGCSNAAKCANCSGSHSASSKECPVWLREKQVQKIKAERNVSFPEARQIVSQQSNLPRSGPSCAQVVSGAATNQQRPKVSSPAVKETKSVHVQTDLTWPAGQDHPQQMPQQSTASQTVTCDLYPKSAHSIQQTTVQKPSDNNGKKNDKGSKNDKGRKLNRPPSLTQDPVATCSRYGVLDPGESTHSDPDTGVS